MPLTPGMCPRAIKAEHRSIYVKMSISTTGAQFPWTRKCVVSRRNAGKNSRHLYRTRSFGREFFSSEMRSRSTKVKILRNINVQQNDKNFNIIILFIEIITYKILTANFFSYSMNIYNYVHILRLKNIIMNDSLFTCNYIIFIYCRKIILI